MVAYAHAVMVAAIVFQTGQVFATPVELVPRADSGWVQTKFFNCMKAIYPSYPTVPPGTITQKDSLKCIDETKGKAKRDVVNIAAPASVEERSLENRQLPDFKIIQEAICDQLALPKNFVIVSDIRPNANQWCNDMKGDLLVRGAAQISPKLGAVAKAGNELHGNKLAVASLMLTVLPGISAAVKSAAGFDAAMMAACTKAVTEIATKGDGCTKEINWYNAGKAKGQTSTGAIPGSIEIGTFAESWLDLHIDFADP